MGMQLVVRRVFACLVCLVLCCVPRLPDAIAGGRVYIVRDEQSEAILDLMVSRSCQSESDAACKAKVYIVNDDNINAFIVDRGRVFINAGTIKAAANPEAIFFVLAHEIGHISGRHYVTRSMYNDKVSKLQMLSTIMGVMASSILTDNQDVMIAASDLISTTGSLNVVKYTKEQEKHADYYAACALKRNDISLKYAIDFFIYCSKNYVKDLNTKEYWQTHPDAVYRASYIQGLFKDGRSLNDMLQYKFAIAKAKITAYTSSPNYTLKLYNGNDRPSLYATAIAKTKQHRYEEALSIVRSMLDKAQTFEQPYLHEMLGQILYISGDVASGIKEMRIALNCNPTSHGIMLETAIMLLDNANHKKYDKEALDLIQNIIEMKRADDPMLWHYFSIALARNNDYYFHNIALARKNAMLGEAKFARYALEKALAYGTGKSKSTALANDIKEEVLFMLEQLEK